MRFDYKSCLSSFERFAISPNVEMSDMKSRASSKEVVNIAFVGAYIKEATGLPTGVFHLLTMQVDSNFDLHPKEVVYRFMRSEGRF
jgi:hypothetical protein